MRTVYEYEINPSYESQTINVPIASVIVNVDMKGDQICLWIEVDTLMDKYDREFKVFETNSNMDKLDHSSKHVGTVLDGLMSWHVYEIF